MDNKYSFLIPENMQVNEEIYRIQIRVENVNFFVLI